MVQHLDQTRVIYAVDPGDVHCGVARFEFHVKQDAWHCASTDELSPDGLIREVADGLALGLFAAIVVEDFILDGSLAVQQAGSKMETSQTIGVIKHLVGADPSDVRLEIQNRQIKTPTRSILRARGIKSRAKLSKSGGHAFDAELHGHYFIGHTIEHPVTSPQED